MENNKIEIDNEEFEMMGTETRQIDEMIINSAHGDIAAVILSAGYSSRMGDFKPLLPIGDSTAIELEINALKEAEIHQITAVIGYKKELLYQLLIENRVRAVYNSRFSEGMFASIQVGVKTALDTHIKGFLLMLVDCPLISKNIILQVIDAHRKNPDALIVPCYRGKKGHPLFIPSIYAKEIIEYDGPGGLKAITNKYENNMIRLEVNDEAVVLDMDTQEGYEEILEYYHEHKSKEGKTENLVPDFGSISDSYLKLARENGVKRLFLVRHGQIVQHQDKIFLGQTDIPLSELGKRQARNAGKKLYEMGVETQQIYTSDLSRAKESAQRIGMVFDEKWQGKHLGQEISIIEDPSLREMCLGEWDGKFISEIKGAYPEEFKKRGEELLAYKYGNDCENFYDLQYRVMKGFKKLLKEHHSEDMVIVSHTGVIKVLLANLHDLTLAEAIHQKIPTGQIIKIDFMQI